jgi:hypothetical protein
MVQWRLTPEDLKHYPHFDAPLSVEEAMSLATNPERVRAHTFFPLLLYRQEWWPFGRKTDARPDKKSRKIRYAARGDAYIYAHYRHLLSERYESRLQEFGISDCVIAYRKIPAGKGSRGGKCNIHFAAEAFDAVSRLRNCCAVALDISKFFEHIDHQRLKQVWCDLLGVEQLPDDHWAVFKNITRYSEVDRNHAYERLGYAHQRQNGSWEYHKPLHQMPKQLCTPEVFRERIVGGDPSLIVKNKNAYGIPQGAPISDLLANAYLIDFDIKMAAYARARGGVYMRYSDDILVIVPGDGRAGAAAREKAQRLIREAGERLLIKAEKASTIRFTCRDGYQTSKWISGHRSNGLEYLGFRFDGENVFLRDSTLSNLNRKIARSLRAEAINLVRRYRGKDEAYLIGKFDVDGFIKRFGRVEGFDEAAGPEGWTFWSYAHRAASVMGPRGQRIFDQLKRQRSLVKRWSEKAVRGALQKGGKHGRATFNSGITELDGYAIERV